MSSSSSWYRQNKVEDLKFVVPNHVREIRDKVLTFVESEVYPVEDKLKNLAGNREEVTRIIKELQTKAKAQGLWALGHPKEIGGQWMLFRDYIYVNEVQGRSEIAPIALGTHSLQDSLMLFNHASPAIKNKYLRPLVNADIYPSFGMTEPDIVSSDPTAIQTEARLENGYWVINGRKWWTSGATMAAFTSVMVRTEFSKDTSPYGAFSIILVPTDTPGYQIVRSTHVLEAHAFDHCEVIYNNVRVPEGNLIGQRGQGFLVAQERLGPGRIFHCMRWLGLMQRAFDLMCIRLCERKFKKGVLADQDLMKQLIFDSYCDIAAHRLMTLAAAEKMDSGDYARVELAAAKAWGARALGRVVDRAVQAFGAKGLTEDTPLSQMYRLARAARFYDGADEVHIESLGRLIADNYKKGKRWDFALSSPIKL